MAWAGGPGAAGVPRVFPGSCTCVVLAGGRCCRGYSSAGGRLGPDQGGGCGALLAAVGPCADWGRLESLDSSVGSDRPRAPEEDESTIVSLPTSVLNPIVVSKLSDDSMGPRSSELSLDDMLAQTKLLCFLSHLLGCCRLSPFFSVLKTTLHQFYFFFHLSREVLFALLDGAQDAEDDELAQEEQELEYLDSGS